MTNGFSCIIFALSFGGKQIPLRLKQNRYFGSFSLLRAGAEAGCFYTLNYLTNKSMKNRPTHPHIDTRKIRLGGEEWAQGYKHINIGASGVFNNGRRR